MLIDAVLEYKVVGSCSGFGAEGSTEEARNVKPRATAHCLGCGSSLTSRG